MTQQGGQPIGGQWAAQQQNGQEKLKKAQDKQQSAEPAKELSSAGPGDDRTPDKTIGEVKYAGASGKKQGGAGEPQVTDLEPEKQGGIGGP